MLLPLFQNKDGLGEAEWDGDWSRVLPALPLRNLVAFSYTMPPLAVGLERSVHLLEDALQGDRLIILLAMTDPSVDEPDKDGVHHVGTLAHIERALRVQGDSYQIVVRGLARVRVAEWISDEPYLKVRVERYPETVTDEAEVEALRRELIAAARRGRAPRRCARGRHRVALLRPIPSQRRRAGRPTSRTRACPDSWRPV